MKVKSSVAALSAGALGLVGATVGASPAAAAVPYCGTITEYQDSFPAIDPSEFFADCVPQYGIGKAEFTITSDSPIPAGFTELTDLAPAASSVDSAALTTYLDAVAPGEFDTAVIAGPLLFDTEDSRTYLAALASPVVGYAALPSVPADLAVLCGAPADADPAIFTSAYRLDFGATSTTYSQLIDGADWSWTITVPARSAWYLFGEEGGEPVICATDGLTAYSSAAGGGFGEVEILLALPFAPEFPDFETSAAWDLGPFARFVPTPVVPPLPATGLETAAPAGIAVGLVAIGALALAGATVVRRRRDASS